MALEGAAGADTQRAGESSQPPQPHSSIQPRWFTPLRLLLIFCVTNLFVYLDRGLIASNGVNGSARTETSPQGSGIQGEFDLSFFEDGLLAPVFLVGLLVASPIFAEASKTYSAFRLLGVGMGVWAAACMLCGLAPSYTFLMTARSFVGVGEASFVALAAPFIDDYAPIEQKATWFAAFFLCIPVGFALGYITGGLIGPSLGWRAAFLLEAAVMVPFVVFALTAQPIVLQGSQPSSPKKRDSECSEPSEPRTWGHTIRGFWRDVLLVVEQKVWLLTCIAYTLYVAVVGVYAYWGPKAGRALFFGESGRGEEADLVFGGVTVVTGVLGSIGGGMALDFTGSSLKSACLICGVSCLAGMGIVVPAFLMTKTFGAFMAYFAVGQLLIFLLQSPVVAIQMWSVPSQLRPLGTSLITCTIHLLGDVPSPPLLGLLQAKLSEGMSAQDAAQQWRISMSAISILLLVAAMLFLAASYVSMNSRADFRKRGRRFGPVPDQSQVPVSEQETLLPNEEGDLEASGMGVGSEGPGGMMMGRERDREQGLC